MATIRTAIQIYDGMTRPLHSIHNAMEILLNSFERVQNTSSNAIDISSIREAREELARAGATFNEIERNIADASNQQRRFNDNINQGSNFTNNILEKMKGILFTVGLLAGTKSVLNISDNLASSTARLNLLVSDGGSVEELEKKIMASAQNSRSSYFDTAAAVAKLGLNAGNAFNNDMNQVIAFMEQVNKQFVIGGATAAEQSNAMLQLTQAMASGALRGEELNSILDAAPGIARAIERYMGVAEGSIKKYAEQGLITSDVVKNALFSIADETNERFESMPKTWIQIWSDIKNKALSIFSPVLDKINQIGNGERFQQVLNGLVNSLAVVANMVSNVFDLFVLCGNFVIDNWSWIAPIIYGVVSALMAYYGVLLSTKGLAIAVAAVNGIMTFTKLMLATATFLQTRATWAEATAQYRLNAALYACPIVWIIVLVITLTALFYALIGAVNKFAGTSLSATGIICGAFSVALAFIGNIFVSFCNLVIDVFVLIYNIVAELANFIGNVFNDPIGSVCRLFFGLADTIFGILQAIAGAIDVIFGSNLGGAVKDWRNNLNDWVENTFGENIEIISKLSAEDMHLDRFEYGTALKAGHKFGKGIESKISGFFDFGKNDHMGAGDNNIDKFANTIDGIYNNTGVIANNTTDAKEALEFSNEQIELLRDIAERESINKYTTAEIKIEMNNENKISSEMDIDGIINLLEVKLLEAVTTSAEGGHI